jgi:ABC-type transporter MlaC component
MNYISKVCAVAATAFVMSCLTAISPGTVKAQEKVVDQIVKAEQPVITPAEKETIKGFEQRVKQYVNLRGDVKAKVPKLAKDSTPEQIQGAESAFAEALRGARAGAKPGDLFTADIAQYIRTTLKREVPPTEKKEIRKTVLDKETNIPVPLKVNYPYPDPKEFVEMPATLLLKLPPLPKELKYRYVGRNLMLVDTDNNLIVDYMVDALP